MTSDIYTITEIGNGAWFLDMYDNRSGQTVLTLVRLLQADHDLHSVIQALIELFHKKI